MARTIIPFGPQHPVLPEPIHLDLVVEDEKVIEARPSIGFIHRGLEKLVEKKDYVEFVYIAERICGICSFIHGQTYCQAVEAIMNVAVPLLQHSQWFGHCALSQTVCSFSSSSRPRVRAKLSDVGSVMRSHSGKRGRGFNSVVVI